MFISDYSTKHASRPMSMYLEMNFDKSYILHFMHVRQTIEPQLAKLAAMNRTQNDLLELENNLKQLVPNSDDYSILAQLDLEFHAKIVEATGNPMDALLMNPLFRLLPKIKTLIVKHVKQKKKYTALNYHQNIFEMIKNQDKQGVFDSMTEHLHVAERDAKMLMEVLRDDEKLF